MVCDPELSESITFPVFTKTSTADSVLFVITLNDVPTTFTFAFPASMMNGFEASGEISKKASPVSFTFLSVFPEILTVAEFRITVQIILCFHQEEIT